MTPSSSPQRSTLHVCPSVLLLHQASRLKPSSQRMERSPLMARLSRGFSPEKQCARMVRERESSVRMETAVS